MIIYGILIFASIISYLIYRKIGKNLIRIYLREIQKNDCLIFNDDEIGKDKFFLRNKIVVKNSREMNMLMFNYALDKPKKLFNNIQDCENEEGNFYF